MNCNKCETPLTCVCVAFKFLVSFADEGGNFTAGTSCYQTMCTSGTRQGKETKVRCLFLPDMGICIILLLSSLLSSSSTFFLALIYGT